MASLLLQLYTACGIKFFALLIVSFVAGFLYVVRVILASKTRQEFRSVVLISLIPLAVGVYATFDGYVRVGRAAVYLQRSAEETARGYAVARVSSYFGAALSAPLVLLSVAGAIRRKKKTGQSDV